MNDVNTAAELSTSSLFLKKGKKIGYGKTADMLTTANFAEILN